jgi:hypothetical protein
MWNLMIPDLAGFAQEKLAFTGFQRIDGTSKNVKKTWIP